MNAPFFLSLHVLAAILTIGPVAVAASMFPRYVRAAAEDPHATVVLALLHRICRVYTIIGFTVPAFGLATAAVLGVLTDPWLLVSILLTAVAAAVLLLGILPRQAQAIAAPGPDEKRTDGATTAGKPPAGQAAADTTTPGATGTEVAVAATTAADAVVADAAAVVIRQGEPAEAGTDGRRAVAARLGMLTGVFNLLWAVVVVLMIVRPGSTTGV